MYYVFWFIGVVAVCMLSVVTGLWVERVSSDKETETKK